MNALHKFFPAKSAQSYFALGSFSLIDKRDGIHFANAVPFLSEPASCAHTLP